MWDPTDLSPTSALDESVAAAALPTSRATLSATDQYLSQRSVGFHPFPGRTLNPAVVPRIRLSPTAARRATFTRPASGRNRVAVPTWTPSPVASHNLRTSTRWLHNTQLSGSNTVGESGTWTSPSGLPRLHRQHATFPDVCTGESLTQGRPSPYTRSLGFPTSSSSTTPPPESGSMDTDPNPSC